MASLVDSKAEFARRAKDLIGDSAVPKLLAESIDTFATLAYAVADQPNHIDETKLDALSKKVWAPDSPTLGQIGALRRLSFEGLTFSLQDLKNRGDPEASSVKQLPAHEHERRRSQQVARLKGVLMEGELGQETPLWTRPQPCCATASYATSRRPAASAGMLKSRRRERTRTSCPWKTVRSPLARVQHGP